MWKKEVVLDVTECILFVFMFTSLKTSAELRRRHLHVNLFWAMAGDEDGFPKNAAIIWVLFKLKDI